MPDVNLMLF